VYVILWIHSEKAADMETDKHSPHRLACVTCALVQLIPAAWAVNGAQPGGHGAANASMGGASIALPLDAEAAANNPAGLAFVPSSATLGLQVFHGDSSSEYVLPGNVLSNRTTTAGPEGGMNWRGNPTWSVGLSIAVGGAGSDYGQPALPVPGASNAKTSLAVIELIPTVAWRPRADIALGLALNVAHERFEAQGVIVPAPVPGGLAALPDHGQQSSDGVGLRAGALWQPLPTLSLGLGLKSRTSMSQLAGYQQDMLAYSGGHLDVPSEIGAGLAWQLTPAFVVAADWLDIRWGELPVMKDPNGFRWRNQPVVRLGAAWAIDDELTLRAGYSHSRRQISSERTVQNLLVPSIHDQAFTTGLTWHFREAGALSIGYEFNPKTTLHGTGASSGTSLTSDVQMLMASYDHPF
jgi:long-chain fatty acid transport protein